MGHKVDVPALWSAEMGQVVDKQNEIAAGVYAPGQSVEEMREGYRRERAFWNDCGPDSYSRRDAEIPTPHGAVKVRMHRPNDRPVLPVIVFIHGGGFILGDLDTHDRITRKLAEVTGAAVIAIDYTLSPEARYPQAIEECAAVVTYLREHADDWAIDARDISFAGDSGGAYLSLATVMWLRDRYGDADWLHCLLLFYGIYGLRDSASRRLYGGEWDGLTEEDLAMYMSMYLGSDVALDTALREPYFNLLDGDLGHGIAPCYVVSAALDPLRDDSRALADLLTIAGTPVQRNEVDGVIHGFMHHGRMLSATDQVLESAGSFYRATSVKQGE